MNIVAILANGVGSRFKSNIPKQFHKVNGKMIIEYVVESILNSTGTDKIVIATNVAENYAYLGNLCTAHSIDLIDGSDTRNRTLKNVIDYIKNNYNCDKLIVCDSVRPMITSELIDKYFEYLNDYSAVVTAQKITDSLGCYDFHKVDRERYYLMQSPEGFDFPLLYENFDSESHLTEVVHQLPKQSPIKLYFDFTNNFKLTYPADLKYIEALITARDNEVDFSNILESVTRLNNYLEVNYPIQTKEWISVLNDAVPKLLDNWQITEYELIKTSHFGLIFIAKSVKYGKCVLKIIPPFINRYFSERKCYQCISSKLMCELYDYNDECSALLLEYCDDLTDDLSVIDFFKAVSESVYNEYAVDFEHFSNYGDILHGKLNENDFEYKNKEITEYVKKAVKLFDEVFDAKDFVLIHGDLHRFNIMQKNERLTAIDPIGYYAPKEIDPSRYIATQLTSCTGDIKVEYEKLVNEFSAIYDIDKLTSALYIDMVFRLHNSIFENQTFEMTDKWLEVLDAVSQNYQACC